MSRESVLIILGVLVAISPFVGLPLSLLAWILPVFGVATAVIGLVLRLRRQRAHTSVPEAETRETPSPLSY